MLGIIKKDLMLILSDKRQRISLLVMVPLFLFSANTERTDWPYFIIVMGISNILVLTPFYYNIDNKSSNLIASLPISRKEIVISKYLGVFIYLAISIVYVGIYLWIINKIGLANVDYFNLAMIKRAIPYSLVSISILLFNNLIFNTRITQIINMVIYMGIILFSAILAEESIAGRAGSLIEFLNGSYFPVVAIGIFIWSMILSIKLYEQKDL